MDQTNAEQKLELANIIVQLEPVRVQIVDQLTAAVYELPTHEWASYEELEANKEYLFSETRTAFDEAVRVFEQALHHQHVLID